MCNLRLYGLITSTLTILLFQWGLLLEYNNELSKTTNQNNYMQTNNQK